MGWVCDYPTGSAGTVHVYPQRVDEADIYHEGDGPRITSPIARCSLCRAGWCVQRAIVGSGDIVVHARERDA